MKVEKKKTLKEKLQEIRGNIYELGALLDRIVTDPTEKNKTMRALINVLPEEKISAFKNMSISQLIVNFISSPRVL